MISFASFFIVNSNFARSMKAVSSLQHCDEATENAGRENARLNNAAWTRK